MNMTRDGELLGETREQRPATGKETESSGFWIWIFGGKKDKLWKKAAPEFRMLCRSRGALGKPFASGFPSALRTSGRGWRPLVSTDALGEWNRLGELSFLLRKELVRVCEKRGKDPPLRSADVTLSPGWVLTFDVLRLAVTGSRLTIPCKVFLGAGIHATTLLWWTANNTHVADAYQGGRVTEGQRQ